MYIKSYITFLVFFIQQSILIAQNYCYSDTCYLRIVKKIKYTYPDSAISICEKILSKKNLHDTIYIIALERIGDSYWSMGLFIKSFEYYNKSLVLSEKYNKPKYIADSYSNIAYIYMELGEFEKSIAFFEKSLTIALQNNLEDRYFVTSSYLASTYGRTKQYENGIKIQYKLIKKQEMNKNFFSLTYLYNNIASNYFRWNKLDSALYYYKLSSKLEEKLGLEIEHANTLYGMAEIYFLQNKYKKAEEIMIEVVKINSKYNNNSILVNSYSLLAKIYLKQKKHTLALDYINLSIQAALITQSKDKISHAYNTAYIIYKEIGNCHEAMEYLEKYGVIQDSIYTEQSANVMAQISGRLELKAKEKEIELLNKENIIQQTKLTVKKNQQNALFGGLALIIAFTLILLNRYKITRKQKSVIETQKHILEDKQKEILDSITYAKRIQESILPNTSKWYNLIPNSFILYLPKDILAGDFYWVEETDSYIFVAVADCTGHGVPGAMVSVVCSNALTKAVYEEKNYNTDEILNRVREIVIEKLTKNESHIRDGMDICLLRIDKHNKNTIQYSGANRPLYYVVTNNQGVKELIEIKPDKQPIGQYERSRAFNRIKIDIPLNTHLYLTTDGYADQFGGENGKKLNTKVLKEIIIKSSTYTSYEQRKYLLQYYNQWKGNLEQIDDVTIIGINIT